MPERFLVVKLADVGDALTATPALRALRRTFSTAQIDALVTPAGAAALTGLDSVDELVVFEKAHFDRWPSSVGTMVQGLRLGLRLRQAHYDRVFLLHHLFTRVGRIKYAALLASTGSPWRAGLAEGRPPFLTHVVADHGYGVRHEADYWLDVVRLAGATNPRPRMEIAIDAAAEVAAEKLIGESDGADGGAARYVALGPGSGWYSHARRWPAERFGGLGRRIARELAVPRKVRILVVGAPDERQLAQGICDAVGLPACNLAGRTDLKTLAAVLRRCALFIGNDGGAMHVAVAASTPVVAIFGPSNHVSWGPYGGATWPVPDDHASRSLVVREDLPCGPCLYRGFLPGTRHGCRARDCLRLVTEDQVFAAARYLLELSPPDRQN
jgi:ADP-heptose:LPS heptosyltransferase